MLKSKHLFIFIIGLFLICLNSYASKESINLKGINLEAIELSVSNRNRCSFENVEELEKTLKEINQYKEEWNKIIDEKIKNARIFNETRAINNNIKVNYANEKKSLTISYEAGRAGISANFLAAITLYYISIDSPAKLMLLPINKQKLDLIKTTLILKNSSLCWNENEYRSNLRIFTSIFRKYLDETKSNSEALLIYLKNDIKIPHKEAIAIVESVKNIENNLIQ
jgi:hypothetical protein